MYELITTHLLPLLHEQAAALHEAEVTEEHEQSPKNVKTSVPSMRYHALLTSHHLISPTKRRNLYQWSSQLNITGFAKVGHPGVMYAEGSQEDVEEFVQNVKAMQWLALRVRFVEPLPRELQPAKEKGWKEFEKVGEVVDEMRRLRRKTFVVEMGIGSTK